MAKERTVKVLMAKPGVEGHWVGLVTVSTALRDAGFEVSYGGSMTPPQIAMIPVQEDVNIAGLSIPSADYMLLASQSLKGSRNHGKGDELVLLGGVIWEDEFAALKEMGGGRNLRPRNASAEYSGICPQAQLCYSLVRHHGKSSCSRSI